MKNRTITTTQIRAAYDDATGSWTGCEWTTQHGAYNLDLDGLTADAALGICVDLEAIARLDSEREAHAQLTALADKIGITAEYDAPELIDGDRLSTKWGDDTVSVEADWAQASCAVEGDEHGRQVADFQHDAHKALRAALEDVARFGGDDPQDAETAASINDALDAAEWNQVEDEDADWTIYPADDRRDDYLTPTAFAARLAEDYASAAEWLRECESNAAAAEEAAKAAMEAAEAGDLEAALEHADNACSIERQYGDCPTWRAFADEIQAALAD